jgi:hypothetical protein
VSEKAREEHLQLLVENEDTPKGQLKGELAKWADKSDIKVGGGGHLLVNGGWALAFLSGGVRQVHGRP